MFSGSLVPDNWSLCDGTQGTPDLTDRFIIGDSVAGFGEAGGTVSAAAAFTHATGGAHTHDAHESISNTDTAVGDAKRLDNPDTHSSDGGHTHDAHAVRKHFVLAYLMRLAD